VPLESDPLEHQEEVLVPRDLDRQLVTALLVDPQEVGTPLIRAHDCGAARGSPGGEETG